MAESEEELKSLLMKVKKENEKAGLKLNIQKTNGVLLSHQKEYIWISSNEVDETGADYTEWISQKEKHQYSIYGI